VRLHPAATAAHERPNNLPAPVTSFIGRADEIRAVTGYLTGQARLVTLTGTGGVGKTRLAQETAWQLLHAGAFPDGVWWVELGSISDPRRVAQAVAAVLGLQEEPDRPFSDLLLDALRPRRLLLVLDNCEHLVQACAALAYDILCGCPHVAILATSREPLKAHGEIERHVPPLERPDPRRLPSIDRLREFEAVRLFAERAAAASSSFHLSDRNASPVARVCDQLDGIPLALELAAARARVLSVDQIAARLDDRFRLLADGPRTGPARQRTLEAAVAWSYDLLGAEERRLFDRLAVFAGGWTLEAAEAICGDPGTGLVLDILGRLVEKSLVAVNDGPNGGTWYRMPETIRQFAAGRLRDSGEERLLRERHFQWYVRFALEAEEKLRFAPVSWSTRGQWLERLRWEIPNLRAAWHWPLEGDGSPRDGLRLGAALFAYFWCGWLNEGSDCLAALLQRDRGSEPTPERAWALATASKLAAHYGDDASAVELANEYLALPPHLWTPTATAFVHNSLGLVATHEGDFPRARAHVSTALAQGRAGGDTQAVALYLVYLGGIASAEGRVDEAQAVYGQAAAMGRQLDFPPAVGLALAGLARLLHARGERAQARGLYRQALVALRDMGAMQQIAQLLTGLAYVELDSGDPRQAAARFGEGLELALGLGQRDSLADVLEGIGVVLATASGREPSRLRPALQLLGASMGLRRPAAAAAESVASPALARAGAILGEQRVATLLEEGRALGLDEATGLARRALDDLLRSSDATGVAAASVLTRREQEVVTLLARGASNRQIADALVIAERTAEMHVSNVLAKLGLTSRAQVAAWAADQLPRVV
jgi:predicted ATPase/DNA-binding CsgD family transcriptional regulator